MKNTCTPINVFGGFNHTLFLGCSVVGFSASAGYNEQTSEVTIQLVEDPCTAPESSPKHYWDLNLEPQTTTDPDPGFFGNTFQIIGAPAYFRVGEWEFCGIIQTWEEGNSESGNPSYTVKLTDPRTILEGSKLIIGEYAGSVGSVYNLFNVFGYAESTGTGSCPQYYQSAPGTYIPGDGSNDGATFGSPADKFGGADQNRNGMQWNQILNSLRILTSSFPAVNNAYSPYGRVVYKAPPSVPAAGMGLLAPDYGALAYYYLDLEDVPGAPSYWRFNGTEMGLLDAITQICNDAGHDYYVELIPVVDAVLGSGVHKFIKVRTVDRSVAPALNSIDTFISVSGREVKEYNKGRELRNEVTSSFVIGGPKQNFYQAEQNTDPENDGQPVPEEADDIIVPFFGLDPTTGNVIIPEINADGYWEFEAPADELVLQLSNPIYNRAIPATLTIDERELIAADAGLDMWLSYASSHKTDLYNALDIGIKGLFDIEHIIKLVTDLIAGGKFDINKLKPADIVALRNIMKPADDANLDLEVMQIGFAWIEKITKDYYGKKYQVRVPFVCGKVDSESGLVQLSDEPTDGGWTEVTPILGLAHPSIFTDFFALDDNRLGAFCRFDNADTLELSGLDISQFVTNGNSIWTKIDVESEYVYIDKNTLASPRVIITLPQVIKTGNAQVLLAQQVKGWKELLDKLAKAPANEAEKENILKQILKVVGGIVAQLGVSAWAVDPDAAGFGIKSNVLKYGPWGSAGPAGAVSVISDEGLVPWEYGGFASLNLAGLATAAEGVTNTQVTEEGSITVAGYPTLPLGAELLAADGGGPFNGGGNNLIENRSVSTDTVFGGGYYYMPIYAWSGTYGPNVTGITVQVGSEGLTTTYTLRTWTPKFGIFSKGNAERLKQNGQLRIKAQKDIRAWALNRMKRGQINAVNKFAKDHPGVRLNEGAAIGHNTPHEILAGQLLPWNDGDYTRPCAITQSTLELPVDLANDYADKAFMSLDGLLRPVSNDGSGGLPRFIVPSSGCQSTASRGAQPPVDKTGQAGSFLQYNVSHSIDYLNPLSNPSSVLTTNLSNTPNHGHDIELIGRGTGVPPSSMIMPIEGYATSEDLSVSDYSDSYRFMALKGPLVLQQWGYDLDGFPVPNSADTPANISGGIYTDSGLTNKFMDNWLRKSETWPVAPVDLRLDRQRGVWTVPQYRNLVVELKENIAPNGNGLGIQISGPTLYDTNGNVISEPELILYDEVGHHAMQSGDHVIASYDPYDCKYRIIEHKVPINRTDIFKFRLLECVCIDFAHRPQGWASGMRLAWNDSSKTWNDDYVVKLYPASCNGDLGPGASGLCGWAKMPDSGSYVLGTPEYKAYHSPTGSGGATVLSMEHMAQYIDFWTTENVGCLDDECYDSVTNYGWSNRSAKAVINDSWDGMYPTTEDGQVVVYFGRNIDVGCLEGHNNCSPGDELWRYNGTAVLDREASSAAICGSTGCIDNSTCGKWVYRVLDLDSPMTVSDIKCTGDYTLFGSPPRTSAEFSKIITRNGIGATIDGCNLILDSTFTLSNTNDCFPATGSPTGPGHPEQLNFGAGLWLSAAGGAYGVGRGSVGMGTETDCLYHLNAGFRPYNNSNECIPTGMPLTTDGTRYINVVDFQGGLYAVDGNNNCDLLIRSGIDARQTSINICNSGTLTPPTIGTINHKIELGKGLLLTDVDPDDCKIELNGCLHIDNTDAGTCVSGNPVAPTVFNHISLGKGIHAQQGTNPYTAVLGAGFGISSSSACVTGTATDTRLHNMLVAGEGLRIEHTDDCEASIGLYLDIDGVRGSNIELGPELTATAGGAGGCPVTINFTDYYGASGVSYVHSQNVISDIRTSCCPSGGVQSIEYNRWVMHFNAYGQLINAVNLTPAYEVLDCGCHGIPPSPSPSPTPSSSPSNSPSTSVSSSPSSTPSSSPSSSPSTSPSSSLACCCLGDLTIGSTLNVEFAGAIAGTGTISVVSNPPPGGCVELSGSITLSTTCGGQFLFLNVNLTCPSTSGSLNDVELTITGGGTSCTYTYNTNPDAGGTCDPLMAVFSGYMSEIIPGGCPCGNGATFSVTITE